MKCGFVENWEEARTKSTSAPKVSIVSAPQDYVDMDGNQVKVTVSSVEHPMVEVHYIDWVCLETEKGIQVHHLTVGEKPETVFGLADGDKVVAAYAYCNLHGLWKTEA